MKFRFASIVLFSCVCPLLCFGQLRDSSINLLQWEINYSLDFPGGDMSKRFGINSAVGTGFTYKLKSNWTFGLEFDYIFGGNVKETNMLDHLKVPNGNFISKEGEYSTVIINERGFYGGVKVGKIFPVGWPNDNSGIVLNVGAGLLQHKINIENKDNNTPSVLGDYKKGYDRLSNGLALREFVGYQYLDNNRFLNFYAGFEFYQAWTQSRRDFDFDTMQKDVSERNDLLFGFRVGWIVLIYKRAPEKYYYY